jgi:uncharacterized protein (TIGR02246 family)
MKRVLATFTLFSLSACIALGQPSHDETAVRAIVDHWRQAWTKFDVTLIAGDFAADADWYNAFGIKQKGSDQIVAFMTGMFKRPNVQGRQTTWEEIYVRFVRPDVALATRDYRTVGHKMLDGKEMSERKTHCTWLLTKDDGEWHIVSQSIADAVAPNQ